MQQLVNLVGVDAQHGGFLVDQAFVHHVDRDVDGRSGGALAVAGLQHPEAAFLNGELDVLHVAVVLFKRLVGLDELLVLLGQGLFHADLRSVLLAGDVDRHRGADAGHDVLALGVDQILAEEDVLAGRGVTGEGHAGGRGVAHVAEDHGLDVDGRAPVLGDVIELAVGVGAGSLPGVEHGIDAAPELFHGIHGQVATGQFLDLAFQDLHQFLEVGGGQVGVELDAFLLLHEVELVLEGMRVGAHDDVGVHLDETAVGIIGEALVAARLDQALDGLVVEAQVQNRVHHAGHRDARARTDREEQRVLGIAETFAHDGLDLGQSFLDLVLDILRQGLAALIIDGADFGRDGEARRHRNAQVAHLGQVGALAAQQVLHVGLALGRGALAAKEIYIFLTHNALLLPLDCSQKFTG
ncbi:MAG: hypothetical protein BWY87_01417 [Deltaproteobacteria bacterium ADurb.Bin510]|nr:MAG: hypothetical protein BWY87_01417 [Deltaproteobacteria bacterium ADurb.Bin510]